MVTFFWPKVAKKCQKSQNLRFLISTVWKLLSEVEPYRTINNEVDVAKKCCQIWQKVAKVAKKCYQMWQKVAKGVPRGSNGRAPSGSKGLQSAPRGSKAFHGVPRSSKGSDDRGSQAYVG